MRTLIFKETRKPGSQSTLPEFVREGSFLDALSHFDYEYPTFYYSIGDEGYDEDVANGASWYYADSNGDLIVRDEDLVDNEEWHNEIDNSFFKSYYTKSSNNLTSSELISVLGAGWYPESFKEGILKDAGFDYTSYLVAEYFDDLDYYLNDADPDSYLEDFYNVYEEEPIEGDYTEVNGNFYTKFK